MDFRKALIIALKDVRIVYTDRNLRLILFAAPLALTMIIGAAFSKLIGGSSDLPFSHIPVAIVNEDKGASIFGQTLNYGNIITQILVPPTGQAPDPKNTLQTLLNAQPMTAEADAKALVDSGKLTAVIIIPPDFSQSLNPVNDKPTPTAITVYRDAASPIPASVVSSVVRNITNNLVSGDVAVFAAKDAVAAGKAPLTLLAKLQGIAQTVTQDIQNSPPITVSDQAVGQAGTQPASSNPLSYFAPALAIFFVTFTAANGAGSIIDESDTGTLQRMIMSPTRRFTILTGKLGGTYLTGVIQLAVLIVLTSLIGPVLGGTGSVWGTNIPGIVLVTLTSVAAATGLGALIAGLARTAQQADVISNALLIMMGVFGGAFFDLSQFGGGFQVISKLTLNFWGTNAFKTLSQGSDLTAILPNIAVLLVMFIVFFGIGLVGFNHRQNI